MALKLGLGFIMVRKRGRLPGATLPYTYDLEYGTDTIEIQADAVRQRIVLLDDLLATGGTMNAAAQLLRQSGAEVMAGACLIELTFLNGRSKLDIPITTLVSYDS